MTRKRKKRFTMSEAIYFLAKVKPHEQLREKQFLIKSILINTMKTETRNFVPIDTLGLPALLIVPRSIQNPNSKEQNYKLKMKIVLSSSASRVCLVASDASRIANVFSSIAPRMPLLGFSIVFEYFRWNF